MPNLPGFTPDPRSSDVVCVKPTGNHTQDTARLRAAIDSLSYANTTMREGTIVVSGRYFVTEPLVIGEYGDTERRPVNIVGASQSELRWMGPLTDAPMLSIYGGGRGRAARLQNLLFNCNRLCRGVVLHRQTYTSCMRDCYVLYSRQVGIDAVNCWGASFDNVEVCSGRGILYRSNGDNMSLRDCRFQGQGVWHGDGSDKAKNIELATFEMLNGRDAAMAKYGSLYQEDWPAEDDTTVLNYKGNPVQTPASQRAACVARMGPQHWSNTIWEQNYYGSRPLLYATGPFLLIENSRWEGNYAAVKCVVEGNGTTTGKCCRFVDNHLVDPAVMADCLVELRGETRGVRVEGVAAKYLRQVVHATSGTHRDVRVDDVMTWSTAEPAYPPTACSDGATIVMAGAA